jgi:hypothetical protein
MERPQVQIVEYPQEEISNSHIPEFEKNNLLAKYGYKKNFQSDEDCVVNTKSNLTFEEMVALEEKKLEIHSKKIITPTPHTFNHVRYLESKYSSLDLNGESFGFEVRIMSDMEINSQKNK